MINSYKSNFGILESNESGYYPAGAEHDPMAPYNQVDPSEKLFDIMLSCSLSKELSVYSENYDPYGCNGAGSLDSPIDDYKDHHYTIQELLSILKEVATEKLTKKEDTSKWKQVLEDCDGWTIDEEVAEQI